MKAKQFGYYEKEPVFEATLESNRGVKLSVITYGAILRDLIFPVGDCQRHLLLGFDSLEQYVQYKKWHIGAVPGRVANRIGNAEFSVNGQRYALPKNQDNKHCLHSGDFGFGARNWQIIDQTQNTVTLLLMSRSGEMGFPGDLSTSVTYSLSDSGTLAIDYVAITESPTLVNLTNHAYFNLSDSDTILDHWVKLEADFYTPNDKDLIPTGEIRNVADTPWDFREVRQFKYGNPDSPFHYDGNVVLRKGSGLKKAAWVSSPNGDVEMEVWTTKPGLQVFDAETLNLPVNGLNGRMMSPRAGFCMEPQFFPDSINQPHFSNTVLERHEVYRHRTEYRIKATV